MKYETIDTILGIIGVILFMVVCWWYTFKFAPAYIKAMDCIFETEFCEVPHE